MNGEMSMLLFVAVFLLLLAGYPVAFTLAGTALGFAFLGESMGNFDAAFLQALPNRLYGIMTNETLVAVPLFVFMGVMLERSRVAENLLETMGGLFGRLRGGLGLSVTLVGMLLAASTGIVGATVVTMGLLSLPTMLRRGYDARVATGTICASGTLGQIIPPSIVLVLLGDVMSAAYQQAQLDQGVFSPETVSVGDLFAGALLPGLMLVVLYVAYLLVVAMLRPHMMPPLKIEDRAGRGILHIAAALLPPLVLIIAVLGSILGGLATPTEAASVGAVGALILAASYRQISLSIFSLCALIKVLLPVARLLFFLPVHQWMRNRLKSLQAGDRSLEIMTSVVRSTMEVSSMVFLILIGASLFSLVFRGFGGDELVEAVLVELPGGVFGAVLTVMLVMFLLGFVLDFIEITFVVVPIVGPVLLAMGLDPIWLGIMIALNLQTSFLTPPFGFALFYLRGVAPKSIRTLDIYRGVAPFIAIQLGMLVLLALWPALATWLPGVIYP
jgi:tripartite ATP-independent transporter DctM subunit